MNSNPASHPKGGVKNHSSTTQHKGTDTHTSCYCTGCLFSVVHELGHDSRSESEPSSISSYSSSSEPEVSTSSPSRLAAALRSAAGPNSSSSRSPAPKKMLDQLLPCSCRLRAIWRSASAPGTCGSEAVGDQILMSSSIPLVASVLISCG